MAPETNFLERTVRQLGYGVDRVVSIVRPDKALENRINRRTLHEFEVYDAANPGPLRSGSGGIAKNAHASSHQANRDRINLMWDARSADRNIAFIGGVLDRLTMHVCGKVAYQADIGDPALNTAYHDYFHDWCGRADITGRQRLQGLARMGFRSMMRDGDFGYHLVPQGAEWRVQAVEADRIGSPMEAQLQENYYGGFTVNSFGAISSVRVFQRSRLGQYENPKEIDPSRFIHLAFPKRTDEYRVVTPLAACLPHARDIYEMIGLQKQTAKTRAMFAVFITPKDPNRPPPGTPDWKDKAKTDAQGRPTAPAVPGMMTQLNDGDNVHFPTLPNEPNGAFLTFIQTLVREMAIALNLPYGFVYDLAQLGGVTARVEVAAAQRVIEMYQELLVDSFLDRVKMLVLQRAIAMGILPAHPNWNRGRWQFGSTLTGDYGYQTSADIELVSMGYKAGSSIAGMSGDSFEDVTRKNGDEVLILQRIAAEKGVPIEMLAPGRFPGATQALAAMNTPPAEPPPPIPGLIGTVGEKGVEPLVDILTKVSKGELEPEAAIMALMKIYGWTRQKAAQMVPPEAITLPPGSPAPAALLE